MDNINHHRRSIRLKGYDYTQAGAYFIILCTWQRNYYEHIIRNEREWDQIIRYIQGNPAQRVEDQLHPEWGMK